MNAKIPDAAEPVEAPEPNPAWHGYALGWYRSLTLSPVAKFYTATDWMTAIIGAEILDTCLKDGFLNAAVIKQFNDISMRLLTTEGDRRKLRIELYRQNAKDDSDEIAAVSSIDAWQRKLTAVPDE